MDLFGRISGFMDSAGPLGLVAVLALLLGLLALAVTGKRMILLGAYLFLLMFSGFAVPAIDAGSTLLRWVVMLLIALTAVRGARLPGPSSWAASLGRRWPAGWTTCTGG